MPYEPIFDEMDAILYTPCKFFPFSQKYLIDVIKYKHIQVNKLYSGKSYSIFNLVIFFATFTGSL